jgi:hypothetical protein
MDDVQQKLEQLIEWPHPNMGAISNWTHQTVDRIVDILQGQGKKWARNDPRYRDHVAGAKF